MNKIIWNESFRANVKAKKGKVVFFFVLFFVFLQIVKEFHMTTKQTKQYQACLLNVVQTKFPELRI